MRPLRLLMTTILIVLLWHKATSACRLGCNSSDAPEKQISDALCQSMKGLDPRGRGTGNEPDGEATRQARPAFLARLFSQTASTSCFSGKRSAPG